MIVPAHFFLRRVKLAPRTPPISVELRPGAEGVIVESAEQAQAFIECAVGLRTPIRGQILYGDESPYASPRLRTQLGSLLPVEPGIDLRGSVDNYLRRVRALRDAQGVPSFKQPDELNLIASLLSRDTRDLSPKERRRIALAISLALQEPPALFLFEPLRDLDFDEIAPVLRRLKELADLGCIVVSLTFNQRSSSHLADRATVISRAVRTKPRETFSFVVRALRLRELASILTTHECIQSTHFDPERPSQIVIRTSDARAAAQAIGSAICESQADVFEVLRVPELPHVSQGIG